MHINIKHFYGNDYGSEELDADCMDVESNEEDIVLVLENIEQSHSLDRQIYNPTATKNVLGVIISTAEVDSLDTTKIMANLYDKNLF